MSRYLERFRAMVDEIKAHPLLEVVEFTVHPPAPASDLDLVEDRLGARLAEPIRSFYGEANGLKLLWKLRPGLKDAAIDEAVEKYDDYGFAENDENPFAQINLIGIADALVKHNWKKTILPSKKEVVFRKSLYAPEDFAARLRPFDLFSDYACMAFFVEDGVGNPPVLMLSDYYVEWNESKLTDFQSYLEALLATRGISEGRSRIFGEHAGHCKKPVSLPAGKASPTLVPKLFRKG